MTAEEKRRTQQEPFVEVLDGDARLRILAAMLDTHQHDVSISQISDRSGVARSTIYEHIDRLVELGLINETREMGKSQMYQINSANRLYEALKMVNVRSAELLSEENE